MFDLQPPRHISTLRSGVNDEADREPRFPPTADPGGAELNRFGGYDARRGLILHRDRNRIRCDRGRARIRDKFQMPPVTAAGETTDASRARPKPPPGRVATATVDAFKRQPGILGVC